MSASPRLRAVVADTDVVARLLVSMWLECDCFEVAQVTSGDEAIRRVFAWEGRVDLLVLDAHLPDRSGASVLRELRRRQLAIPAVLLAEVAEPGLITIAGALGVPLLKKPLALDRLGRIAHRLVAGGRPTLRRGPQRATGVAERASPEAMATPG